MRRVKSMLIVLILYYLPVIAVLVLTFNATPTWPRLPAQAGVTTSSKPLTHIDIRTSSNVPSPLDGTDSTVTHIQSEMPGLPKAPAQNKSKRFQRAHNYSEPDWELFFRNMIINANLKINNTITTSKTPTTTKDTNIIVDKNKNKRKTIAKGRVKRPQKGSRPTVDPVKEKERIITDYLSAHKARCELEWENRTLPEDTKPLCDCVPAESLVGLRNVSRDFVPFNITEAENPEVEPGGRWAPRNCTARYRLVVIIPYRDRMEHLSVLLHYLHPILQGQQLNYTILVVEQNYPETFNKASIMNIGYVYARDVFGPDCVVFNDVDMIPEDGRHFYACRRTPLHLGAFHSRHKYRLIYRGIFGGVTAFRPDVFERVNGFSNRFFGWGGEDDEMSARLREHRVWHERDPREVAGYSAIIHTRDAGNVQRNRGYMIRKAYRERDIEHDGLNSLRFIFQKTRQMPLYTWVLVDVLNDDTRIGFDLT